MPVAYPMPNFVDYWISHGLRRIESSKHIVFGLTMIWKTFSARVQRRTRALGEKEMAGRSGHGYNAGGGTHAFRKILIRFHPH